MLQIEMIYEWKVERNGSKPKCLIDVFFFSILIHVYASIFAWNISHLSFNSFVVTTAFFSAATQDKESDLPFGHNTNTS